MCSNILRKAHRPFAHDRRRGTRQLFDLASTTSFVAVGTTSTATPWAAGKVPGSYCLGGPAVPVRIFCGHGVELLLGRWLVIVAVHLRMASRPCLVRKNEKFSVLLEFRLFVTNII